MRFWQQAVAVCLIVVGLFGFGFGTMAQEVDPLDSIQERLDEVGDSLAQMDVSSGEYRVEVLRIVEETEVDGMKQMIFEVEFEGQVYQIDSANSYMEGMRYKLKEGDDIYIQVIKRGGVPEQLFLADVVRYHSLVWMAVLLVVVIVAVGRLRGVLALIGLAITLAILLGAVIPLILGGASPVLVAFFASVAILAINMHLAHGVNKQTMRAFLATTVGAGLVLIFALLFTGIADLSGLSSEESILLYYQNTQLIIPRGILLAGILLGAVGVLDDIAINQSELVAELREANPKLTRKELFVRAMRVGRHHIASTVNTLVLAYAGVALPLLLLFNISEEVGFLRFLNEEPIMEEIVRTIAGTLGLILTVPIATWFATMGTSTHRH